MAYEKRPDYHYTSFKGINQKGSKYTLDNAQALNLRNVDFNIPNAWTKREGSTQIVTVNTSGPINSLYEFERLNGASYIMASSNSAVFYLQSNAYVTLTSGYSGQPFDFQTFNNHLFFVNGQTNLIWDGASLSSFQMGIPRVLTGASFTAGTNPAFLGTPLPAVVSAFYTFFNSDGLEGCFPGATMLEAGFTNNYTAISFSGLTNTSLGATSMAFYLRIRSFTNVGDGVPPPENQVDDPQQYKFLGYIPKGTTLVTVLEVSGKQGRMDANGATASAFSYDEIMDGFNGSEFCFTASLIPRYIEIQDNRLFLSGFSAAPSLTYFSDIGAPEIIQPDSSFEIRTNDGDRITAMKAFQDELMIYKVKSFHKLIGDSPDNYTLVQLSTEYGCLSNKAIVEYNNMLMFLDEKGIVQYNGADWKIISFPIEDVFRRMNVPAAIENASAVHNGLRNQVWFGIPVDGSTRNNLTVVYDYLLDAWTFFDGFSAASFSMLRGSLTIKRAHFGDYSGKIHHFSPTFYGDNGAGITTYIQTKFDSPDGANVENMFRQLFLDVQPVTGLTGTVNVRVFNNYDSSTVRATMAVYQGEFQTRRDFGVAGKSVGFDFMHFSASLPITYYGYTVKRRYLRDV